MTNTGELREVVRFEQRALDVNNSRLGPWTEVMRRSARIYFRRGSEPVIAARLQGVQPVDITVRNDEETRQVTNAWRVVNIMNGQIFNITAVAPDEDRSFITFLAQDDGRKGGG